MKNDLISRQGIIDKIEWYDEEEYMHPGYIRTEHALKMINNMPSAERKGKWTSHPNADCPEWDVCTCCGVGCKRREYGEENGKTWVTEYSYQFCPNCGARMVSEDEKKEKKNDCYGMGAAEEAESAPGGYQEPGETGFFETVGRDLEEDDDNDLDQSYTTEDDA